MPSSANRSCAVQSGGSLAHWCRAGLLAAGLGAATVVSATPVVFYTATDVVDAVVGVDTWQYDFVVDGSAQASESVNLLFNFNQFADLQVTVADPALLVLTTAPDPGLLGDGQVTAIFNNALTAPLGFGVSVSWLGTGAPGALPFEVLDDGFSVIGNDRTRSPGGMEVPEPPMVATVLMLAAASMVWRRRATGRG